MIDMMVLEQSQKQAFTIFDDSYIIGISLDQQTLLDKITLEKLQFSKTKEKLTNDPMFAGRYVAVRNGEIIDSDVNQDVLLKRIYKEFGYIEILIEKIDAEDFEYTTSPTFDTP